MAVFVCLHITLPHYHHNEVIELLKILVMCILSSVCLRLKQFSLLFPMQHIELCAFTLPIHLMMIVRIRVLYLTIIIKSEVWPICHCLWLGQETMLCAVSLSIVLLHYFVFEYSIDVFGALWMTSYSIDVIALYTYIFRVPSLTPPVKLPNETTAKMRKFDVRHENTTRHSKV